MKKNIFFDVDSTLVTIEGLDYLSMFKDAYEKVSKLTLDAMSGDLSMREAMEEKMKVINPSYSDFVKLGEEYIRTLVPGAKEVITQLKDEGHEVWLITGNFQPAVGILAEFLGIPESNVFTSKVVFDDKGNYNYVDFSHPLANNNGKAEIINNSKVESVIMIGDSITDLDTKDVVEKFICFTGVVKRDSVVKQSDYIINDLREVLNLISS